MIQTLHATRTDVLKLVASWLARGQDSALEYITKLLDALLSWCSLRIELVCATELVYYLRVLLEEPAGLSLGPLCG